MLLKFFKIRRFAFVLTVLSLSAQAQDETFAEAKSVPQGYRSWTHYRIENLNAFGARLLAKDSGLGQSAAKKKESLDFSPLAPDLADFVEIKMGPSEAGCFGKKGKNIYSDNSRDNLVEQFRAAAQFAHDYYVVTKGKHPALFPIRAIRICHYGLGQSPLAYDTITSTLTFNIKRGKTFGYNSHTRDELVAFWEAGRHVGKLPPKVQALWKYVINPIGPVQIALREHLAAQRRGALEVIGQNQPLSPQVVSLVDQVENEFLSEMSRKAVANVDSTLNLDIQQYGIINVGNLHSIHPTVSIDNEAAQSFEVISEKTNVTAKVRQVGVINVFTVDDVRVNVKINWKGGDAAKVFRERIRKKADERGINLSYL